MWHIYVDNSFEIRTKENKIILSQIRVQSQLGKPYLMNRLNLSIFSLPHESYSPTTTTTTTTTNTCHSRTTDIVTLIDSNHHQPTTIWFIVNNGYLIHQIKTPRSKSFTIGRKILLKSLCLSWIATGLCPLINFE